MWYTKYGLCVDRMTSSYSPTDILGTDNGTLRWSRELLVVAVAVLHWKAL